MQFEDSTASQRTKRILALCAELLTLVDLSEHQRRELTELSVRAQQLLAQIERERNAAHPLTKKAGKTP